MNVDLEPFIYRQHPVYRLPSREDAELACRTPDGEKAFREAMQKRGEMIYNELDDPYRYGYEPPHWKEAEKLLEENDELLISGGNRSSKSEFSARYCVTQALAKPNQRLALFHTTYQSSLQNQQPVIWKYLPQEYRKRIG